ncbi:uncharacterized protein LOC126968076 isoform X2 [Leptidea sinapis]|nr:uncharacterized protein LOC126968076 isoform X2 [Leptidea sinapis]
MNDEELLNVKSQILDIFGELEENNLSEIEKWITSHAYKKDLEKKKKLQKFEKKLVKISKVLREIVPFEAEMQTENIVPPTVGDQADCTKINTCHVDEFLYDDKEVDELVQKGKLSRFYCVECNSRNCKELIFISHSMSTQMLQYIFNVLLPKDLENKQILDVGSRLGAVLYGAYYFSNVSTIIGVEMNKECCDIQETIIKKFAMDTNRIKIVHSDIMKRSDIVQCSNIVVINVLDFFVDIEKHKEMWYFFKKNIKCGSYLITNRSMVDTLTSLGIFEDMLDWLTICKCSQFENEIYFDIEDYKDLHVYIVNK